MNNQLDDGWSNKQTSKRKKNVKKEQMDGMMEVEEHL